MHHGGRDGSWKDPSMHNAHVDFAEAISRGREAYDPEVRHCMSLKFGQELGE